MKVEVGSATDIGRVRERNEDSVLVDPPLYVVADGMGGHRGGQVASQVALETMETLSAEGRGSLAEHVRKANRAVWDRSEEDEQLSGMGTTLTAARIDGASALIAHVGDSRAYRIRDGEIVRLTRDHSLLEQFKEINPTMTREEENNFPHKNVITRALGMRETVQVDIRGFQIESGDVYVLCSDGLSGMVPDDSIRSIVSNAKSLERAVAELVDQANRHGGTDNITTLLLQCMT